MKIKMKSILILGGAKCVWEDVDSLDGWDGDVAAVNDVGTKWHGPLIFWATLHPRKLPRWEKTRRLNGFANGYIRYSHRMGIPYIDKVSPDWGGSSGLFAIKVALEMGYTDITLAGIPMTSGQAHYFNTKKEWTDADAYWDAWIKHEKVLQKHVRSCSGRTRNWFGGPSI